VRGVEVRVEGRAPRLRRLLEQRSAPERAGGVHEGVDPPEGALHLAAEATDRLRIADVTGQGEAPAARRLDGRDGLRRRGSARPVADGDPPALAAQVHGDGAPDAPRASGHEGRALDHSRLSTGPARLGPAALVTRRPLAAPPGRLTALT